MDRVNSGLLKLTCPLLVTAIDLIEDEGHIDKINSKLTDDVEGDEAVFFKVCVIEYATPPDIPDKIANGTNGNPGKNAIKPSWRSNRVRGSLHGTIL